MWASGADARAEVGALYSMRATMLTCGNCAYEMPPRSNYCEACGTPLVGTPGPERLADEVEAEFLFMQVQRARVVLLLVATLQLVFGGLHAAEQAAGATPREFAADWAVALGVPAVFFFLAWWCERSPLAAALVGLVVFVTLHGAAAAVDPSTLATGLFLKLVVVTALLQAIAWGVKFRAFRAERGLA